MKHGMLTEPAGDSAERVRSLTSTPVELLTFAEAAELLTISVRGMRRLHQRRALPFIKIGGSIRFAKVDVATYVAKCRVNPIG